jgi:hypothetical protein
MTGLVSGEIPMQQVTLRHIAFGSFIKLCATIFFAVGISAGIGMLILSLLGANVYVHFNQTVVTGVPAGLIAFVFVPPISALIGVFAAIVAFLPYRFVMQMTGGISVMSEFSAANPIGEGYDHIPGH